MTKEEKFEKLAILDFCLKIENLYESGEECGTVKFNDKEFFVEFGHIWWDNRFTGKIEVGITTPDDFGSSPIEVKVNREYGIDFHSLEKEMRELYMYGEI